MPQSYKGWEPRADHLTSEEIIEIARACTELGIYKFRLTGGEPLLRKDLVGIVRKLTGLSDQVKVALTTNGLLLEAHAGQLKEAGLHSVNISLDAIDPERYRQITGGRLERVLAGIRAVRAAEVPVVKLNAVLIRGVSEPELMPLARFAAGEGLPLRLIELMPLTSEDVLTEEQFFPISDAKEFFASREDLIPLPEPAYGWGPARYFRLSQTGTLIGFIGALTDEHFCESCNKMRLTADGKIRPCLGDAIEVDARSSLRSAVGFDAIPNLIREAIQRKPEKHQFANGYQPCRPMTAIGG